MNLTDLNNYLNLVNPSNEKYKIALTKELTRGDEITIQYIRTLIPRCINIYQNNCEEFILEADKDELGEYYPWLYRVLNIEYLTTRSYGYPDTFHVKVYKVSMKD